MEQLLRVSKDEWKTETDNQKTFYDGFGARLPQDIRQEFDALRKQLG